MFHRQQYAPIHRDEREFESFLSGLHGEESEQELFPLAGNEKFPNNSFYPVINLGFKKSTTCLEKEGKKCIRLLDRNTTALFHPSSFNPNQPVHLLLYFHGHLGRYPGNNSAASEYLNFAKNEYLNLREDIEKSGKNIILVMPTLGTTSEYGILADCAVFDEYLANVKAEIKEHILKKFSATKMKRGKLILSGHSGGGKVMLELATFNKVDEVWGFDSIYQGGKEWPCVAKRNKNIKLFFYYHKDGNAYKDGTARAIRKAKSGAFLLKPGSLDNLQLIDVYNGPPKKEDGNLKLVLEKDKEPHFAMVRVALRERLATLNGTSDGTEWEAEDFSADKLKPAFNRSGMKERLWEELYARFGKKGIDPKSGESMVTWEYAKQVLETQLAQDVATVLSKLNGAGSTFSIAFAAAVAELVHKTELHFIFNPSASSLDLLPREKSKAYKAIAWGDYDFPGNSGKPKPKHQNDARKMHADFAVIRPERRPNLQVVTESEFCANKKQILKLITPLNKTGLFLHARESFDAMKEAALNDGVQLDIIEAYRYSPSCVGGKLPQKSANKSAVADYSSHMSGLAVDLAMSFPGKKFIEKSTTPFYDVMEMRKSPVHKWMFLKGAAWGWYPYSPEPWHWEYNPEGYRKLFREAIKTAKSPKGKERESDFENATVLDELFEAFELQYSDPEIGFNPEGVDDNFLVGKFDERKHSDFTEVDPFYILEDKNGAKPRIWLLKEVYAKFVKMFNEAQNNPGGKILLKLISGTRNFAAQRDRIWTKKWNGEKPVNGRLLPKPKKNESTADQLKRATEIMTESAMPGTSRHHWGTDIDIISVDSSYFNTNQGKFEYDWLRNNAHRFGFCQPYTYKNPFIGLQPMRLLIERPAGTSYEEEKWHWSYIEFARPLLKRYIEKGMDNVVRNPKRKEDKFPGHQLCNIEYIKNIGFACQ